MTETVPRDSAFWNTYRAVQAEEAGILARARFRDTGHEIVWRSSQPPECGNCGMSRDDAMWDDGWARIGDQWMWAGPLNLLDLDQQQTTIRIVTGPDGAAIRCEATLVHAPTGARVDMIRSGTWEDEREAVYRQLMVEIAKIRHPEAAR